MFPPNVAVMRLPSYISNHNIKSGKDYLNQYTKNMFKVSVYWGEISEFSEIIRKRLNDFKSREIRILIL